MFGWYLVVDVVVVYVELVGLYLCVGMVCGVIVDD